MNTMRDYDVLMKSIGYQFVDTSIFMTALTHKSAMDKEINPGHGHHNERMEFLGDAVLSLVTANYLYRHKTYLNEGELSRLRAQFVCEENLSRGAKLLGLGDFIVSDKAMRASGSNYAKSVLADALEALIGAVFIDGGLVAAEAVIFKILDFPSVKLSTMEKDAKTKLQEMVQREIRESPKYILLKKSGPAHAPTFLVGVKIKDDIIASAEGENKRIAAQNAAVRALEIMEKEQKS
jgi:ribonuclease III